MFILICGLPNAGKTTYSKRFENVLHLDDFPRSKFLNCNEAVRKAKGDIVVEGIYNIRCRRKKLLENVKDEERICIWINTPLEVCLSRNGRSKEIVLQDYRMFQPPTLDEGWTEIKEVQYDEKHS